MRLTLLKTAAVLGLLSGLGRFVVPAFAEVPLGSPRPSIARPEESPPRSEEPIELAFAGDINLGRECGLALLADANHDPFSEIGALWKSADARFANLESVLSNQNGETESKTKRLVFTGPPAGAEALARANINVVSTANNHSWDYGRRALLETLNLLDEAKVAHVGTGSSLKEAEEPWTLTIRGTRIAYLAFTGVWNQGFLREHPGSEHVADGTPKNIERLVKLAKENHHLVIVSYHGGEEYTDLPVEYVQRAARAAIKSGADAFIGHHPHVPEGVRFLDGKPVLYSLGNFVFSKVRLSEWSDLGLIAKLEFSKKGPTKLRLCPISIGSYAPKSLKSQPPERVREALRHLRRLSRRYGTTFETDLDAQGCVEAFDH